MHRRSCGQPFQAYRDTGWDSPTGLVIWQRILRVDIALRQTRAGARKVTFRLSSCSTSAALALQTSVE